MNHSSIPQSLYPVLDEIERGLMDADSLLHAQLHIRLKDETEQQVTQQALHRAASDAVNRALRALEAGNLMVYQRPTGSVQEAVQ